MKKILELRNKEEKNELSHIRRFLAYAIDWYLGGVVASLPIIIIYMMLHDDATSIPQNIAIFAIPIIWGCEAIWIAPFMTEMLTLLLAASLYLFTTKQSIA